MLVGAVGPQRSSWLFNDCSTYKIIKIVEKKKTAVTRSRAIIIIAENIFYSICSILFYLQWMDTTDKRDWTIKEIGR